MPTRTLLGAIYKQQGRMDEAIREYQAALRIKPDDAAHHILGAIYRQQGRIDGATTYQARSKSSRRCGHALLPGYDSKQQGRIDEAIHEYQAALRIKPDDDESTGAWV